MIYKHVSMDNTGRRGGQRHKWFRWSQGWKEIEHRPYPYLIRVGVDALNIGRTTMYYSSFSSEDEKQKIICWRAFHLASIMLEEMEGLPVNHMLTKPGPHRLGYYRWGIYEDDGVINIPW